MLNVLECPNCKVEISVQTNKAIAIRKEVLKLLTIHIEKSAHYEKMSKSYKELRLDQLYQASVKDMIMDYTRRIEVDNVD